MLNIGFGQAGHSGKSQAGTWSQAYKEEKNMEFRLVNTRALTLFLIAAITLIIGAQAQTLSVLHSFGNAQDGANPYAGLVRDAAGNVYGTTVAGGAFFSGVVFKVDAAG